MARLKKKSLASTHNTIPPSGKCASREISSNSFLQAAHPGGREEELKAVAIQGCSRTTAQIARAQATQLINSSLGVLHTCQLISSLTLNEAMFMKVMTTMCASGKRKCRKPTIAVKNFQKGAARCKSNYDKNVLLDQDLQPTFSDISTIEEGQKRFSLTGRTKTSKLEKRVMTVQFTKSAQKMELGGTGWSTDIYCCHASFCPLSCLRHNLYCSGCGVYQWLFWSSGKKKT